MNHKTPFAEVLHTLKHDPSLHMPFLHRLSDIGRDDMGVFQVEWPTFPPERRSLIAHRLIQISEDDYMVDFEDIFHFFLSDQDAAVRRAGVAGLWSFGNTRHINPILHLLESDEDEAVRAEGAATLGNYAFQSLCGLMPANVVETVLPALLNILQSPLTPAVVRRRALESASYVEDERIFDFIADAYENGDFLMQVSAITAMGISGALRWLLIVLDELENPYEEIRLAAVKAAGQIGDEQPISQLVRLIEEDDEEIQIAAIESLAAIGGEVTEQILLEMLDDPAMEDLYEVIEEALEDLDWANLFESYPLLDFRPDDMADVDDGIEAAATDGYEVEDEEDWDF